MTLRQVTSYISAFYLTATAAGGAPAANPAKASGAVKIDKIAARYELQSFSFEVNPETGGAEIRLEYDYPLARIAGDDTDEAPGPKLAAVPGLTYDPSARAIVYDDGATRTTCATASGVSLRMKRTGACIVATRRAGNNESGSRSNTLDTWFEVRR
jgi:hypothetical protein